MSDETTVKEPPQEAHDHECHLCRSARPVIDHILEGK